MCDDDHGFLRRVFEANLTVGRFAVEEFVHVEGQQTIIAMVFKADFVMTAAGFYIAARRRRWKIAFTERQEGHRAGGVLPGDLKIGSEILSKPM